MRVPWVAVLAAPHRDLVRSTIYDGVPADERES